MRTKKHLGQNFLVDTNIIHRIIKNINPQESQNIVEIGPGRGALTEYLINEVSCLNVIEIDKELIPSLIEISDNSNKLKIFNESILNFNLNKILTDDIKQIRLVGNLPYNISSPILIWSFNYSKIILDKHFMFQKEFAERLVATPGNKSYGRLSIISQYLCDITLLFYVGAECFRPIPEVDSAVIRIIPKKGRSYNSLISQTLQNLTQIVFSKRRKMVGKTLKNIISSRELESIDISPSQRPEEISVEKFVMLAQIINLKKNG